MRVLFFILVVFVSFISAQTPFEKATQSANKGNYAEALEIYGEIIAGKETEKMNENYLAKIYFNTGICRYHLKQTGEAVAEFEKAIKLRKGVYQKAFYALGMAQSELKNWRKAREAFLDSLKLRKDDGEAWFDLALIYFEEKNLDVAEAAFRNSIKFQSIAAADAHNNLGVIFALKDDYILAENEFKTALIKSNGTSVEAGNNLRFCLFYGRNGGKSLIASLKFSSRTSGV